MEQTLIALSEAELLLHHKLSSATGAYSHHTTILYYFAEQNLNAISEAEML